MVYIFCNLLELATGCAGDEPQKNLRRSTVFSLRALAPWQLRELPVAF